MCKRAAHATLTHKEKQTHKKKRPPGGALPGRPKCGWEVIDPIDCRKVI